MTDNDFYSGEGGKRYLEQRHAAQSDRVQGLRARLFQDVVSHQLVVLDFGCGTGGVLARLAASKRLGVEISASAAAKARAAGVEVFESLEALPSGVADLVISFHAIEHVDEPLHVLREIRRVVSPSGRVRLVVPCETPLIEHQRAWRPNSDRHLFTWTPLLFGNLAQRAGFANIETRVAPMPTESRLVRALRWAPPLSSAIHVALAARRNSLNVILDARSS